MNADLRADDCGTRNRRRDSSIAVQLRPEAPEVKRHELAAAIHKVSHSLGLGVHSSHRRRGAARAMIQFLEVTAQQHGCATLELL